MAMKIFIGASSALVQEVNEWMKMGWLSQGILFLLLSGILGALTVIISGQGASNANTANLKDNFAAAMPHIESIPLLHERQKIFSKRVEGIENELSLTKSEIKKLDKREQQHYYELINR